MLLQDWRDRRYHPVEVDLSSRQSCYCKLLLMLVFGRIRPSLYSGILQYSPHLQPSFENVAYLE